MSLDHAVIAPILLPLVAAVALLFVSTLKARRVISLAAAVILLIVGIYLTATAAQDYRVYALGAWPAPYGIVLVLDRLSAVMVLLTGFIALFTLGYAVTGEDRASRQFHPLFQLQLVGLNGAFLTGDLFNLFVFFEVLLIASYGLLVQGATPARLRAGVHYVVLNLAGSALFLVAVGILYAVTGTLNMADLALQVANADRADVGMIRTGALLLLVVFGLKAALFPLYFWLPNTYSAAIASVAALFALLTKVGAYAILRVFTLIFGPESQAGAGIGADVLLPAALLTLALGALGMLSSIGLRQLVAYSVVASIGTLLVGVSLFNIAGITAAIYYLVHSTAVGAGLFLLVGLLARRRGASGDSLTRPGTIRHRALLGSAFLVAAMAVVGIPPLSGFTGKLFVLRAVPLSPTGYVTWSVVLVTGLLMLIALSRAGSLVFWKARPIGEGRATAPRAGALIAAFSLLSATVLLSVAAGPVIGYAEAAAQQLLQPDAYIRTVLESTAVKGAAPR